MTKFLTILALALASVGVLSAASSSAATCPEPAYEDQDPCYPTTTTTSTTAPPETTTTSSTVPVPVDLPDCDELPDNIPSTSPDYRPELDHDNDGVACDSDAPPVAPPAVPVVDQPNFAG